MKKLLGSAFVVAAMVSLVSQTSSAHFNHHDDDDRPSNSKRASCEIGGVIPVYTALKGKCIAGCKELSLTSGVNDKTVMQVTEHNNTPLGYKVTLFSANAGKLKNQFVSSALIPYTAKYNGAAVSLLSTGSVVTNQGAQIAPINITKDLKVTIAPQSASSTLAGYYSDTLTFEIAAN